MGGDGCELVSFADRAPLCERELSADGPGLFPSEQPARFGERGGLNAVAIVGTILSYAQCPLAHRIFALEAANTRNSTNL